MEWIKLISIQSLDNIELLVIDAKVYVMVPSSCITLL